jgi:hypothetical protein
LIGIDSIVAFDDGSGVALYVANNGGVSSTTTLPPDGTATWTNLRHDADGVWSGATRQIPSIGKLRPGEKGVPVMLPWSGVLFVARNRDDGVAELWRYDAGGGWSQVIDTSSTLGGMNPNNSALSMVAVNGSRLYLGFDNETDGAEVWRTTAGVTAATVADHDDFEQVGLSGLGPIGGTDLEKNKHIISDVSIFFNGDDYLYITVGCTSDFTDNGACDRDSVVGATDFAIRMFRQVD